MNRSKQKGNKNAPHYITFIHYCAKPCGVNYSPHFRLKVQPLVGFIKYCIDCVRCLLINRQYENVSKKSIIQLDK